MPSLRTPLRFLAALTLALAAHSAQAALTVGSPDGWNLTVGGYINGFLVSESGDAAPAGHVDYYSRASKDSSMRIRTGFLPSLIGFTAASPDLDGLKLGARVGLYPQINGRSGQRTSIDGPNIDVRELNFTVDGSFGQILMGRTLTLFGSKAILNDMSLFGVGHPASLVLTDGHPAYSNGPTLGHIGSGYLYSAFDAQVRYTSPDLSGFKVAVAIVDPSNPGGASLKSPSFEGEVAYAGKAGSTDLGAWVSGIYQSSSTAAKDLTSSGASGGVTVGFAGLNLLGSGTVGSGLGTAGVIDDALGYSFDSTGKARTTTAFMGQATYTIGTVKIGASFSQLALTKNDVDKAAGAALILDSRTAVTGGIYYDLRPSLKLVAEYTNLNVKWTDAAKQSSNTIGIGGFLFF